MRLRTRYTQRLPTAPKCVLDIPMFEGSGTKVLDVSGKGNHGTITDAVWTRDVNGVCMSFNGTSAYIDCGNDASLNITDAITIEAWVKFNSLAGSPCVLTKGTGVTTNYWMDVRTSGDTIFFGGYTSAGAACYINFSGCGFLTDEWYHFAGTYDKIRMKFYINAVEKADTAKTCTLNLNTAAVTIGNKSGGQHFNGAIDEVRIYAVALTAEQIKRRYEQTKRDYVRAS